METAEEKLNALAKEKTHELWHTLYSTFGTTPTADEKIAFLVTTCGVLLATIESLAKAMPSADPFKQIIEKVRADLKKNPEKL